MNTIYKLALALRSVIFSKKCVSIMISLSLICLIAFGEIIPIKANAISIGIPMSVVNSLSIVKNGKLTVCKIDSSDYEVVKKVKMTITAYTSTPDQTDDSPFITASNKQVADGIIANNMLPFGTKVRIPELYGDKVFVVEDRMHSRKGLYHADIWMEDLQDAKNFGAKTAYIEVIES